MEKRKIREQEKLLISFLLRQLNLEESDYPISEYVDEYEGGMMGSIGLGLEGAKYAGDMVQVEYLDNVQVVITLTKDSQNKLLDLDFWKVDFSR